MPGSIDVREQVRQQRKLLAKLKGDVNSWSESFAAENTQLRAPGGRLPVAPRLSASLSQPLLDQPTATQEEQTGLDPQLLDAQAALAEATASNNEMRIHGAQTVLAAVEEELHARAASHNRDTLALELRGQMKQAGAAYTTDLPAYLPPMFTNYQKPLPKAAKLETLWTTPSQSETAAKAASESSWAMPKAASEHPAHGASIPSAAQSPVPRKAGISWTERDRDAKRPLLLNTSSSALKPDQPELETIPPSKPALPLGPAFDIQKFVKTYATITPSRESTAPLQMGTQPVETEPFIEPNPVASTRAAHTASSPLAAASRTQMDLQLPSVDDAAEDPHLSSSGMLRYAKNAHSQASKEMEQVLESLQLRLPEAEQSASQPNNFTCRHCGQWPITGLLFRCVECVGFELCARCEEAGKHDPSHPLLQIRLAPQGANSARSAAGESGGSSDSFSQIESSFSATSHSFSLQHTTPSASDLDNEDDDDESFFWLDTAKSMASNSDLTSESTSRASTATSWEVNSVGNTTASQFVATAGSQFLGSQFVDTIGSQFVVSTTAGTQLQVLQEALDEELSDSSEEQRFISANRLHSTATSELSSSDEIDTEPWEVTLSGVQWFERKVVSDTWVQWREVAAEKRWLADAALAAVSHMDSLNESAAWFQWKSKLNENRADAPGSGHSAGVRDEKLQQLTALGFNDETTCRRVLLLVDGDIKAAVRELMRQELSADEAHDVDVGVSKREAVQAGASVRHDAATRLQAWHRGITGRLMAAAEVRRRQADVWRFLTNAVFQWRGVAAEMRAATEGGLVVLGSNEGGRNRAMSHGELGLTREVSMLRELGFEDPIACKRALVLMDGNLKAAVRELASQELVNGRKNSSTCHDSPPEPAQLPSQLPEVRQQRQKGSLPCLHTDIRRAENAVKLQALHRGNLGRRRATCESNRQSRERVLAKRSWCRTMRRAWSRWDESVAEVQCKLRQNTEAMRWWGNGNTRRACAVWQQAARLERDIRRERLQQRVKQNDEPAAATETVVAPDVHGPVDERRASEEEALGLKESRAVRLDAAEQALTHAYTLFGKSNNAEQISASRNAVLIARARVQSIANEELSGWGLADEELSAASFTTACVFARSYARYSVAEAAVACAHAGFKKANYGRQITKAKMEVLKARGQVQALAGVSHLIMQRLRVGFEEFRYLHTLRLLKSPSARVDMNSHAARVVACEEHLKRAYQQFQMSNSGASILVARDRVLRAREQLANCHDRRVKTPLGLRPPTALSAILTESSSDSEYSEDGFESEVYSSEFEGSDVDSTEESDRDPSSEIGKMRFAALMIQKAYRGHRGRDRCKSKVEFQTTVGALRSLGFGNTARVEGVLNQVHGNPKAAVRELMGMDDGYMYMEDGVRGVHRAMRKERRRLSVGVSKRGGVQAGASVRHDAAIRLQAWHRGITGRLMAAAEVRRRQADVWRFLTNAVFQWRGVAAEMRGAHGLSEAGRNRAVSHGELGLTREVSMLRELGFEDPIACKRALVLMDGNLKAAVRELASQEHEQLLDRQQVLLGQLEASKLHAESKRVPAFKEPTYSTWSQRQAATKLQAWHRGNLARSKVSQLNEVWNWWWRKAAVGAWGRWRQATADVQLKLLQQEDFSNHSPKVGSTQVIGVSSLNWAETGEGKFPQNWGDTILGMINLNDNDRPEYYETQELMLNKQQAYAAIKLQAVQRGRISRKSTELVRQESKYAAAAGIIQRNARAKRGRNTSFYKRSASDLLWAETRAIENKAATTIQSQFRSRTAVKVAHNRRAESVCEVQRHCAAIVIQTQYRGHGALQRVRNMQMRYTSSINSAVSTSWILRVLSEHPRTAQQADQRGCVGINIADIVLFSGAAAESVRYFAMQNHVVCEQSATKKQFQRYQVCSNFLIRPKEADTVVALFINGVATKNTMPQQQPETLTSGTLRDFIAHRWATGCGLLVRSLESTDSSEFLHASWSLRDSAIQNAPTRAETHRLHLDCGGTACTWSSDSRSKKKRKDRNHVPSKMSSETAVLLLSMLEKVVLHAKDVAKENPQQPALTDLSLTAKLDATGKLWFLHANSLKLENPPEVSLPEFSRYREFSLFDSDANEALLLERRNRPNNAATTHLASHQLKETISQARKEQDRITRIIMKQMEERNSPSKIQKAQAGSRKRVQDALRAKRATAEQAATSRKEDFQKMRKDRASQRGALQALLRTQRSTSPSSFNLRPVRNSRSVPTKRRRKYPTNIYLEGLKRSNSAMAPVTSPLKYGSTLGPPRRSKGGRGKGGAPSMRMQQWMGQSKSDRLPPVQEVSNQMAAQLAEQQRAAGSGPLDMNAARSVLALSKREQFAMHRQQSGTFPQIKPGIRAPHFEPTNFNASRSMRGVQAAVSNSYDPVGDILVDTPPDHHQFNRTNSTLGNYSQTFGSIDAYSQSVGNLGNYSRTLGDFGLNPNRSESNLSLSKTVRFAI